MLYYLYELNHAAMAPARVAADMSRMALKNPLNPFRTTSMGKGVAAALDVFERVTRRYGKPEFGIDAVKIDGHKVPVKQKTVWSRPFCNLLHFERQFEGKRANDPKLVIVAPLSGHYATLLRGTVRTMLQTNDVYITDWVDARQVPISDGRFGLDDYVDYLIDLFHHLGPNVNVMAVCQPSVPVLAAVALMSARRDPMVPATMTLMGGPIDTRVNPTDVNRLAELRSIEWFRRNVIVKVPFPNPGMMRDVYPGFLQLTGFMSMNLDRHLNAHKDLFVHLVHGDGDSAAAHKKFYDEYLSVMDLTAEFYLETVKTVFMDHALPKGEMTHHGERVDLGAIDKTALFTVEGEMDDISGPGQTEAAQHLCTGIPEAMKQHYLQPTVGHYGVFNGSRFRKEIAPRIADFTRTHAPGLIARTTANLKARRRKN